ncbi:MAG TPA: TylF/MycF/NovP-related O-methyltransferase [Steroidobacteraceae bacterium]|nr:TylF/MycF/NovP-related O-methyltransferase [Steroidobacteraceae bacterium]
MKRTLKRILGSLGYEIVRRGDGRGELSGLMDLTESQRKIISTAMPFTMTSAERMAALINAVTYISENSIPGDIAECGVWRGGSMMVIALTLLSLGDRDRSLHLYDTFEGMSEPTAADKSVFGISAAEQLRTDPHGTGAWCYASYDDVRTNVLSTGYPEQRVHLIKGKVEQTIPRTMPSSLALLRLDTDWYESTRHELIHLYPLLQPKGILIIDDYGHWQGAKQAVDEYFRQRDEHIFLHRIDYTGRLHVK